MKIALISPKAAYLGLNPQFQEFFNKNEEHLSYIEEYWNGFNPSLLALAGLCPSNVDVTLIDENYSKVDFSQQYDLVGISTMTQQAERAYEISAEFRKNNIPVILGGVHPTLLPNEAIKYADSILIGEAENIWEDILVNAQNNQLKQIYKSDDPVSLTDIPLPRYDLLDESYNKAFYVQTSRGCNHDCEFCATSRIFGMRYRQKTIEQVVEEITVIKKHFDNPKILFSADNLFVNKQKTKEMIQALIPLKITWRTVSDISIAQDDEAIELLRESGCTTVFIGFESINAKNLENLDRANYKFKQLHNYAAAIQKLQSSGIGVMGAFIVGFDFDDKNTFKEISDFIITNHLASANITILTPFPGTRLRERLQKDNRILDTPWSHYTLWDTNITHPNLTKEELDAGLISIYKRINSPEVNEKKILYFKNIFKELYVKNLKSVS